MVNGFKKQQQQQVVGTTEYAMQVIKSITNEEGVIAMPTLLDEFYKKTLSLLRKECMSAKTKKQALKVMERQFIGNVTNIFANGLPQQEQQSAIKLLAHYLTGLAPATESLKTLMEYLEEALQRDNEWNEMLAASQELQEEKLDATEFRHPLSETQDVDGETYMNSWCAVDFIFNASLDKECNYEKARETLRDMCAKADPEFNFNYHYKLASEGSESHYRQLLSVAHEGMTTR